MIAVWKKKVPFFSHEKDPGTRAGVSTGYPVRVFGHMTWWLCFWRTSAFAMNVSTASVLCTLCPFEVDLKSKTGPNGADQLHT